MKRGKTTFLIIISTIFITFFVYNNLKIANVFPLNNMTTEPFQKGSIQSAESSITPIWTPNGTIISNANESQSNSYIISDGVDGAIIVWMDGRNSGTGETDIYTQRINSAGVAQWSVNGVAVCTANYYQTSPCIVGDGSGGAIIAWQDRRSVTTNNIYAQRVDSNGNMMWTNNGIPICIATDTIGNLQILSDGAGGAFAVWRDNRVSGELGIYAQRINSSGDIQWTINGIPICTTQNSRYLPNIVSDEDGGAIITWYDNRDSGISGYDIYAQRVNSTGDIQWNLNGIPICTAKNDQRAAQISGDNEGGAIIVWSDKRNGLSDIFGQRVNSTGDAQWIANGTAVCTAIGEQTPAEIVSDEESGAIIVWADDRNVIGKWDIYAQRVNSTGEAQWIANGTVVSDAKYHQTAIDVVSDGKGGVFITWNDERNTSSDYDIYTQNFNSTGDAQWTVNGLAICNAINDQIGPSIVRNGEESVIITWSDARVSGTTDFDIYAQMVAPNTIPTSNHPGTITTFKSGNDTIDWTLYDDFGGGQYRVWTNDSFGNYYVWQDWYPWINNTLLKVPINRTTPGMFNYTIEYYDAYNLFGVSDNVIVSITNTRPNSNHPGTIISPTNNDTIDWILYDDFGGGQYRVWTNDTFGNYYIWQDWYPWINNTLLKVPINLTISGVFNYTIEYYDAYNLFGVSDTVIVSITNARPNSNHPGTITMSKTDTETIDWTLYDDFGGGQYRVWANDTSGNFYVWQNWQLWTSGIPLNVPINSTISGIFNYTIEYYDAYNLFGVSDTVIVNIITEPLMDNGIIPFGNYYIIFMVFGILSLSIIIKLKILSNNK